MRVKCRGIGVERLRLEVQEPSTLQLVVEVAVVAMLLGRQQWAVCTVQAAAGLALHQSVVGMEVSHLATDLYGLLWTVV